MVRKVTTIHLLHFIIVWGLAWISLSNLLVCVLLHMALIVLMFDIGNIALILNWPFQLGQLFIICGFRLLNRLVLVLNFLLIFLTHLLIHHCIVVSECIKLTLIYDWSCGYLWASPSGHG